MLFLPANEKLATIILLTIPVGFLSFLSPLILIALPEIILHFMAGWNAQYVLAWHYSTSIIPWAVLSGIYGCLLLKRIKPISLVLLILTSSFLSNFYFAFKALSVSSQIPNFCVSLYNLDNHKSLFSIPKKEVLKKYYQRKKEIALFETLKAIIPKDVPISVQDNLLAHFSQRRAPLYEFPDFDKAEYVILNTYGEWLIRWQNPEECNKEMDRLLKDNRFQVFFKDNISGNAIGLIGKKERKKEVIRNAKRLVKENSKSTYAHFILGSIYFFTGNLKEVKKEFEIALRLDPKNPFAKQMLEETKKFPDKEQQK